MAAQITGTQEQAYTVKDMDAEGKADMRRMNEIVKDLKDVAQVCLPTRNSCCGSIWLDVCCCTGLSRNFLCVYDVSLARRARIVLRVLGRRCWLTSALTTETMSSADICIAELTVAELHDEQ